MFDKISYVTKTEYAIAIGSINNGVLNRNNTTNVVEVGAYALENAFTSNANIRNVFKGFICKEKNYIGRRSFKIKPSGRI